MDDKTNTYGAKIYIYALIDENNQIIYVGKSNTPKNRLANHKCNLNNSKLKMEILDYFYDVENYWVRKLTQEGHNLSNKELFIHSEEWEKGDIIDTKSKSYFKIYDTELNITYNSMYELSKVIKIDLTQLRARIDNPEKYKEFTKYQIL
jgi:excinuclease UvrABC nuclease subunit